MDITLQKRHPSFLYIFVLLHVIYIYIYTHTVYLKRNLAFFCKIGFISENMYMMHSSSCPRSSACYFGALNHYILLLYKWNGMGLR